MKHTEASKPILFTTRLGPNFLWHVPAAARIGYDSEYGDRFGDSISAEDVRELKRHEGLLLCGDGEAGALAPYFTTFPGWLHAESKDDFASYFQALQATFRHGDFNPLIEAFGHVDWDDPMVRPMVERGGFPADRVALAEVVGELGRIYLRAYDEYVREIWPIAQEEMEPRVEELSRHFGTQNYIALWERQLRVCFRAPVYEFVLCYANKNGPDYNSLGYNGNLIFYDKPFDRTWQLVSHEIGTHLLIDSVLTLASSGRYDWGKLYGAYEVMAMFFNRRVLGLETLAYTMGYGNADELLAYYAATYCEGMMPSELLEMAAERYCRVGEGVVFIRFPDAVRWGHLTAHNWYGGKSTGLLPYSGIGGWFIGTVSGPRGS